MAEKNELVASLEKQIQSLEDEIGKLKELANKVTSESTRIKSEAQDLEDQKNILKMEIDKIKKTGETWKDLEIGVQKQLEDLTLNISAAFNKFKDRAK